MTRKRILVIGAGLAGLTAAVRCLQKGNNVTVFERLGQAGGVINTIYRKGYMFEASSHQTCGFFDPRYGLNALKVLGLEGLQFNELDFSFEAFEFGQDGIKNRFLVPAGNGSGIDWLIKKFPLEKDAITRIFHRSAGATDNMIRIKRLQRDFALKYPRDLITALCLKKGAKGSIIQKIGITSYQELANQKDMPGEDLLAEIKDPDLKFILSQYCYYLGVTPKNGPAILYSILFHYFISEKPNVVTGGTRNMIEALVKKIQTLGGKIEYQSEITEIITENGRACGVRAADGSEHRASKIISNVNAWSTFKELLSDYDFKDEEFCSLLDGYVPSISNFIVYLGLPIKLDEYGFKASTMFFTNSNDINSVFNPLTMMPSRESPIVMTNYGKSNPECFDGERSSLVITEFDRIENWKGLSREQYQKKKKSVQEMIIDKVQGLTGLPLDRAEVKFSATPGTIQTYSGNPFGSMLGAELNLRQSVLNRFDPTTPVKNLYLAGTDTKPAGGISACFDAGIVTGNLAG
jgi:phytoene dehydrogenase-like protein